LSIGWPALGIVSLIVWYHLFLCSRDGGGYGYAIGHLALSVLLTPLLYIGVLLVPLLVESDLAKGVADWRSLRETTWLERVVGW